MQYRLGIDLGGTTFKVGLVDPTFQITAHKSAKTDPHARSAAALIADIASVSRALLSEAGLSPEALRTVGIGTPGRVNPKTGEVFAASNLGWSHVPLQQTLSAQLGVPVHIGSDASCALLGEVAAGAAKGADNVLLITLGTGVGSAFLMDGRLFTGKNGLGTELGHTLLEYASLSCSCGNRGCYEVYASVSALIRITQEAMAAAPDSLMHAYAVKNGGCVDGRTAFDCSRQGDGAALSVVDRYTSYVAAGLGSFLNTNVFRPDLILIGGGISREGEYLIGPIREKLPRHTFAGEVAPLPALAAAALGNDAGIIGAACLD